MKKISWSVKIEGKKEEVLKAMKKAYSLAYSKKSLNRYTAVYIDRNNVVTVEKLKPIYEIDRIGTKKKLICSFKNWCVDDHLKKEEVKAEKKMVVDEYDYEEKYENILKLNKYFDKMEGGN